MIDATAPVFTEKVTKDGTQFCYDLYKLRICREEYETDFYGIGITEQRGESIYSCFLCDVSDGYADAKSILSRMKELLVSPVYAGEVFYDICENVRAEIKSCGKP